MAYRDSQPGTIFLKDYQAPKFLIDKTDLVVELGNEQTTVRSTLAIRRNPDTDSRESPLELHGIDLESVSLAIDGVPLGDSDYFLQGELLHINRPVPDSFQFQSEVVIRTPAPAGYSLHLSDENVIRLVDEGAELLFSLLNGWHRAARDCRRGKKTHETRENHPRPRHSS